jgi:hypothetical protein
MKIPQLSLRDLFWIVLVAALLCGWWLDQARITQRLNDVDKQRRELEAERGELEAGYAKKNVDLQGLWRRMEEVRLGREGPQRYRKPVPEPLMPFELPKESDDST